ncbi:anhydro-N-acetylmuramic acid kinase [Insolitispirillum peregrinum]|uniref:Anhydro-N-acetylmuramic acid kinase n=1 Tax=Insolitispirillum peregrinum TaxID=80876 RepID=A0A1N7PM66_9PROT|nr:anhydro-N-acetylmuramic acid kinase [Insolitispirillum peregrinum]SIT11610.1 anhydro-N-acetylmuramic acid kinase [Insolitispirillum peregrinum]
MTVETFAPRWAIGLMSGTSLDGIDAALIESDGERVTAIGPALTVPYPPTFRAAIYGTLGERGDAETIARVETEITRLHGEAVMHLMNASGMAPEDIAVVGFHGQTIAHRPEQRYTRQLGNGAQLANTVKVPVVFDLRSADVQAGGQGAPLVPVFHAALAEGLERPLAVLNIGGVANVTLLSDDHDLLAFDTGPGNALIDDWMHRHTGTPQDADGAAAAAGTIHRDALTKMISHPWFSAPPPKSLDRDAFMSAFSHLEGLSLEDGAATLSAFTALSVARAASLMPVLPKRWLVCGGGRNNPTLMRLLNEELGVPVEAVEEEGWHGDALEAQAFGFLALRHLRGLPLTFPGTTGCPQPMTGGRLVLPEAVN